MTVLRSVIFGVNGMIIAFPHEFKGKCTGRGLLRLPWPLPRSAMEAQSPDFSLDKGSESEIMLHTYETNTD